jgi:predicted 3-demethylubiquinone-9 3-methyltransferase (glyoxalase superfamily)
VAGVYISVFKNSRAMLAMLKMKKIDIAALRRAFAE